MMNGLNGWKSIDKGPLVAKERERLRRLHQQALDRIGKDDGVYRLQQRQSTEVKASHTVERKALHHKFNEKCKSGEISILP